MIVTLASSGAYEEAVKLAEKIKDPRIKANALRAVKFVTAKHLAEQNKLEAALKMLKGLDARSTRTETRTSSETPG